jgi:hypothetical protein
MNLVEQLGQRAQLDPGARARPAEPRAQIRARRQHPGRATAISSPADWSNDAWMSTRRASASRRVSVSACSSCRAAALVVEPTSAASPSGAAPLVERVAVLPLLEEEPCADLARDAGAADLRAAGTRPRLDRRVRVARDGPHAAQRGKTRTTSANGVEPERAMAAERRDESASATSGGTLPRPA